MRQLTKAKEGEDKFEADRHHKKSLCHPPESPEVDKSSAEFRWRLEGDKGVGISWKPVVMLRCLEFAGQEAAGCLMLMWFGKEEVAVMSDDVSGTVLLVRSVFASSISLSV